MIPKYVITGYWFGSDLNSKAIQGQAKLKNKYLYGYILSFVAMDNINLN